MTAEVNETKLAQRKPRRSLEGLVATAHQDKTIKVVVEKRTKHPNLGKYVRQ